MSRPERPEALRHGPVAQLLIAWSPLSLILVAYGVAEWGDATLEEGGSGTGANRLGSTLHVAGPAAADRSVFGGVPSVWLQAIAAGCDRRCRPDLGPGLAAPAPRRGGPPPGG